MHFSSEGAIGIGLGLIALFGTGAIMIFPTRLWIGWSLIAVSVIGFALLGAILLGLWEMRIIPKIGMIFSAFFLVGCAIWYFWPPQAKISESTPSYQDQITQTAQGGIGGSGEIFGNNGLVIGGKGGSVGTGGRGRGGDGGGGIVHGDNGIIIGGEGGSVDGINIWFPPAQSAYIQYLESQGQTPDFDVQYPGAGGASGGWLQRQQAVAKIREEYFRKTGQDSKVRSSKISDVPLEYINDKLSESGYPWRARVEKKYWYLYYVPGTQ